MPVVVVVVVIAVLLVLLRFRRKVDPGKVKEKAPALSHCPLCGTRLNRGERVHTAAFPGKDERIVYVYGCPNCYDKLNSRSSQRKRRCPVCRKTLQGDDHLKGRILMGEEKNLLKISGCSHCSPYG